MINVEKIKKSEAQHIIQLIEEETRAEILARFSPLGSSNDFYKIKMDKRDELLRYLFDSDSHVELGYRWKLLRKNKKKKRRKKKRYG